MRFSPRRKIYYGKGKLFGFIALAAFIAGAVLMFLIPTLVKSTLVTAGVSDWIEGIIGGDASFSYNEKLENPYELTEFCFRHSEILERMIFRNYSCSSLVRLSIISAIKKFIEDGGNFTHKMNDNIMKYMSFLGGAFILDSFEEKELQEKIYNKLIQLYIEEEPTQTAFKL